MVQTGALGTTRSTSVDQTELERDVPKLLSIPAVVHGVSIEPQLAPVRLGRFAPLLQWVINSGESGAGSRPFHLEWTRALVTECRSAGIPIFVQRLGSKPYEGAIRLRLNEYAGGDWSEWPDDLRIREFPNVGLSSEAAAGVDAGAPYRQRHRNSGSRY